MSDQASQLSPEPRRINHLMHNGVGYTQMTPEALLKAGVPTSIVETEIAKLTSADQLAETRQRISAVAGDIPSLLGTTADVAALGLLGAMQLLIILAENGSPEIKDAIAKAAIPMPVAKAKALIQAIKQGTVKVPALMKGIDKVYAEVAARSTATTEALGLTVTTTAKAV